MRRNQAGKPQLRIPIELSDAATPEIAAFYRDLTEQAGVGMEIPDNKGGRTRIQYNKDTNKLEVLASDGKTWEEVG